MNAIVQSSSDKAREIEHKCGEFTAAVNDVLWWVPNFQQWIIEPIRAGMADFDRVLREFWDRVAQLFQQPGIADDIGLDKMRSNVEWQGPAAEAYKAQVPPQGEALMAAKDIAVEIRTSLDNLANSIDSFWLAIKFAFAGFVIAMVGAIAAACTIVGIPAAIGVVVAAAAAAIGLITAAVLALESHVNAIENEQTAIRQKVKDLADGWPLTDTAAIADASTHDGDPADWRPNR